MTIGGLCEQPKLQKDFDLDRYIGRWYEFYRARSLPFQSQDCGTATYVREPGNWIQVNNQEWGIAAQDWPTGNPSQAGRGIA